MDQHDRRRAALSPFLLYLAILGILAAIAYVGRPILLPFAIAVVIWFIIKAFAHAIHGRSIAGVHPPPWISYGLAIVVILLGLVYITAIISANIARIAAVAPVYEANLDQLIVSVSEFFALGDLPDLRALLARIDISAAVRRVALSVGDLLGSTGLILIYVSFLLVEQRVFGAKLEAYYTDHEQKRLNTQRVMQTLTAQIEAYLRIKTLTSMLTGGISYAVLWWFEVDFAGFWAIIIFLLNYIPTIGSLLGVIFPAFIALVQFDTLGPFFAVTLSLAVTQIVIGNVVEPALMGRSLNMSPLVIILSLSFWGTLWGVAGMFLAVPLTMIAIIILSNIPSLRPIAILLSSDGRIDGGVAEQPPAEQCGSGGP